RSSDRPGAALLAARAAYRAGAGLVQVATTPGVQAMLAGQLPEAIWLPLPTEAPALESALTPAVEKANAVLLGPGLDSSEATSSLLQTALKFPLPASVIDADGLRWLAADPGRLAQLPANSLLTPHPGEMAALTGLTTQQVQADRLSLAEASAKRWGHVVVLKGAFTVVAAPDGRSAVLPLASPALARAGS